MYPFPLFSKTLKILICWSDFSNLWSISSYFWSISAFYKNLLLLISFYCFQNHKNLLLLFSKFFSFRLVFDPFLGLDQTLKKLVKRETSGASMMHAILSEPRKTVYLPLPFCLHAFILIPNFTTGKLFLKTAIYVF